MVVRLGDGFPAITLSFWKSGSPGNPPPGLPSLKGERAKSPGTFRTGLRWPDIGESEWAYADGEIENDPLRSKGRSARPVYSGCHARHLLKGKISETKRSVAGSRRIRERSRGSDHF